MTTFLSFDTETTGFGRDARILELALIYFNDDGKIVDILSSRFNPEGVDWQDPDVLGALKCNGVVPSDLEGCPRFETIAYDIKQAFKREKLWVAHNVSFDLRMIDQEMRRCGLVTLPIQQEYQAAIDCTMKLDRKLNPRRLHSMLDTAETWGVVLDNAHTAEADAKACGEVYYRMMKAGHKPPLRG